MPREHPDPYLVLGVSPTATQAEITHAYRTRLRAHHPDTRNTPSSTTTADDDLRQILAAYDLLRDPGRRADYDNTTVHPATPASRSPHGSTHVDRRPAGRVQIPITYRTSNTAQPPLRAGPVRRHR
jgi:curved DNA-binding protein CbpA